MTRPASSPAPFQDPARLADAIIERVGKQIVLALPLGLGKANHIANALYARAVADPGIHLRIFTALTLEKPHPRQELERRFFDPLSERFFGGYPELAYAVDLHRKRLPPNVEVDEFFFQAGTRLNVEKSQQNYISANYTHALGYILQRGVNVVAQLVAGPATGDGRYSLSCNTDITLDLLACRRDGRCQFLFAGQTNSELPYMPGDAEVSAAEFDFMLSSPATDFPAVRAAARVHRLHRICRRPARGPHRRRRRHAPARHRLARRRGGAGADPAPSPQRRFSRRSPIGSITAARLPPDCARRRRSRSACTA